MSFWENFWDIFWWFFIVYAFFAFLYALWIVIADLFRDRELSGWWKAVWIVFLAFLPFLTLLVYMVARGKGIAERSRERAQRDQESADSYIRSVTSTSPSDEIAKAKSLLDAGTISADEFERIKARVTS
ncbi:type VI protein secretion system component VasK [Arthrobacter ginsengisoli]|uniref:Type VI protein secretion system component VasK n=1 Tax=Arthrobacter ginsengisoli TaxID=1356565 RepID=A0ABU1UCC8_9MICC|nr:SHOCT domain-containing protein [Arthrobacter ginsengisoli]MDR7082765.1 type VI protein secretion system component VasK [Arthrobacter ginsengisoli]